MKQKYYRIIIGLILVLFVGALFIYRTPIEKVEAASIPKGGGTIESSTAITAGSYTVGAIAEKENQYYSISVKAGQELVVTGTFKVLAEHETYGTNDTIEIYNDTKESLVSKFDTAPALITSAALADSSKIIHTYYIRISDDTWGTESGTLTITLNDRYDAGSTTDAGGSIETAMAKAAGSYTGYLSAVDTDDYYLVSASKGAVSAKVTPAKEALPYVKIYDANRKEIASEGATNGGEIVTATANIGTDQKVYIQVNCDINTGCDSAASKYTLVIAAGSGVVADGTATPVVFDGLTPVAPGIGDLVTLDKEVAPILKTVYVDKVKLQEVKGKDTLVYLADRSTTSADLAAIKAAMEAIGYKTKSMSDTQLVMTKGFKKLTFTIVAGTNTIEVKKSFTMNYLWLGIILGAIFLFIILLIVIILVAKRKKTSTPPSASSPPITSHQKK